MVLSKVSHRKRTTSFTMPGLISWPTPSNTTSSKTTLPSWNQPPGPMAFLSHLRNGSPHLYGTNLSAPPARFKMRFPCNELFSMGITLRFSVSVGSESSDTLVLLAATSLHKRPAGSNCSTALTRVGGKSVEPMKCEPGGELFV